MRYVASLLFGIMTSVIGGMLIIVGAFANGWPTYLMIALGLVIIRASVWIEARIERKPFP